nr:ATP-binding protein [Pyrinomonadaceae bacterium]
RLMVIFVLMVTIWIWNSGRLQLSWERFPQGLFLIFLISVGLTIVYFFLLRLNSNYLFQISIQFVLDSLLVSWLVWRSGDFSSPYITLYIVLVSVASYFLRPLPTLLLSVFCGLQMIVISVLAFFGWIEFTGAEQATGKLVQIVSFNIVGVLVVGLLASRLADRRTSGEELKETAKSLANLRLLHERIIESIRSGLITTDLEGTIYTFNAAAAEITGFRSDDFRGGSIFRLFGDIKEPIRMSLEAAEAGEQSPRFETDLQTPDGFAVRIGYSISKLFSETNEASGLIITFQDLTDIRSMEDSIRRKDRLAAVGRVAAGLAHEIRNPLGAMRGAIQVMETTAAPDTPQASLMEIILKESDRLNSIITNFLNYARPAAVDFADTNVGDAIREVLYLMKHSPDILPTHELIDDSGSEEIVIPADSTQLKQIFWNLARNAVQAMPDGGKLTVGLGHAESGRVRITFTDTGRGMSQEQVEQLFEPFANSTTGGTGLGLSIVYQIVKDHNGAINVRSTEGVGTTITIELPKENRAALRSERAETGKTSELTKFLNVADSE